MRTPARFALAGALVATVGVGVGSTVARTDDPTLPAGSAAPTATAAGPNRPPLLPAPGDAPVPSAAGLGAGLAQALADPALGGAVAASVVDARTGEPLLDVDGGDQVVPASTAKIATAVAVLTALPPDTRLRTRALAGPQPGDVVLVGGGDVTLAGPRAGPATPEPARLADLADRARVALAGTPVARVLVDDTAYAAPATGPGWKPGYVSGGDVAPVGALSVDGGRVAPGRDDRVADPALAAGAAFAALLGAPGVPVVRGTAPPGAAALGAVDSPTVPQLVEQMLTRSDNDLAETLAHRLALAQGLPATFEGGAAAVRAALAGLVPAGGIALVDGSGLSRDDRVRPAALAGLLSQVVRGDGGRLGPVLSGLPVAGFDGTLEGRFRAGPAAPAAGEVRAKTGTLQGVSALAGLVRTADGRLLAFDVTLNAVPAGATDAAQAALDRFAAALASCGCR